MNQFESGDEAQSRFQADKDASATNQEIVEARAASRNGNRCTRHAQIELQKRRCPAALSDAPPETGRQSKDPRIVEALRHVVGPLPCRQHQPIAHSVRDPFDQPVELLVRAVVVPRLEGCLQRKLDMPAAPSKRICFGIQDALRACRIGAQENEAEAEESQFTLL